MGGGVRVATRGAQVLGAPIDQCRLGSSHRVRAVVCRVKTELLDPAFENPRVLPRSQMWRIANTTWEHERVRLQSRLLDPLLYGVSGGRRDLELHWALGLVLHHDCAGCHLVAMTNISDLQADKVAAPELAVDSQVEKRKLADSVFHLKAHSERLNVSKLERGLLPYDFALVPWLAASNVGYGFHDGLPSS